MKPIKHVKTYSLPMKEVAGWFGIKTEVDPYSDIYHAGYTAKDAANIDDHILGDELAPAKELFPELVALAMDATERAAYAEALEKSREDAVITNLEDVRVDPEYMDTDGNMIKLTEDAGITKAVLDRTNGTIKITVSNPEHLLNTLKEGLGETPTLDPAGAPDPDIKAALPLVASYFTIYGHHMADGDLDSRFSPNIDPNFLREELKYHLSEVTIADAELAMKIMGGLPPGDQKEVASKIEKLTSGKLKAADVLKRAQKLHEALAE